MRLRKWQCAIIIQICVMCVYMSVCICVCVYIHVCVYEEGQFQSIDGYNRYTGAYFGS